MTATESVLRELISAEELRLTALLRRSDPPLGRPTDMGRGSF